MDFTAISACISSVVLEIESNSILKRECRIGNETGKCFRLIVDNADNFFRQGDYQYPHSAFSTLHIFHTPPFCTLLHIAHSSFSTLLIFYAPRFPHSALCTMHIPPITKTKLVPGTIYYCFYCVKVLGGVLLFTDDILHFTEIYGAFLGSIKN